MILTLDSVESLMQIALVFIAGMATGLCLLQLYFVLRWQRGTTQGQLFALLLVGVLAYVITPVTAAWFPSVLQTLVPGAFWLLCLSLFDDRFRLRYWQLLVVAATVVLPAVPMLPGLPTVIFHDIPQVLELVLVALALVVVARHWQVDLVQSRRRLRVLFCGLVGAYTFALIFAREVLFGGSLIFDLAQYGATTIVLILINVLLLRFGTDIWQQVVPEVDEPELGSGKAANEVLIENLPLADMRQPEVAGELLEELARLMEEECVYREMGLAIGKLAARLEVPEYRLRQAINTGLGYRNFNDFLNRYRIKEASSRLVSSKEKSLPILTIALDVGFRSLSSFNKAFKEEHKMTPTEFRKEAVTV
jgi:AraC-like DNA-binding protein